MPMKRVLLHGCDLIDGVAKRHNFLVSNGLKAHVVDARMLIVDNMSMAYDGSLLPLIIVGEERREERMPSSRRR